MFKKPGIGGVDILSGANFGGNVFEDGELGCLFSIIVWIVIGLFEQFFFGFLVLFFGVLF